VHQIAAQIPRQVAIIVGVQQDEIGRFARLQGTYASSGTQRACAVECGRRDRLFRGQTEPPAGHRDHCLHVQRWRVVWIEVGAQRNGHSRFDQCPSGWRRADAGRRAGQQRRNNTGLCERCRETGIGVLQVVDAQHLVAQRHIDGVRRRLLIRVDLAREAQLAGATEIAIEVGRESGVRIPSQIGELSRASPADLGE